MHTDAALGLTVDDFARRVAGSGMTCTEVATRNPPVKFAFKIDLDAAASTADADGGDGGSHDGGGGGDGGCTSYRGFRVTSKSQHGDESDVKCVAAPAIATPEAQPESTTPPETTIMSTGPTFQYWTTNRPDDYDDDDERYVATSHPMTSPLAAPFCI